MSVQLDETQADVIVGRSCFRVRPCSLGSSLHNKLLPMP